MKKIILSAAIVSLCFFARAQRTITVDVSKIKGATSQMFRECIGAGRAEEGLRADWQQQLVIVQQNMHFKYIRFHGLLNDEMHIYTEDAAGNPVYNWQYLDRLYDFLLSVHLKPFVEFGFMPPALASSTKTVFWWKGNVTPPKDYQKWAELIKAMLRHWQERYGDSEVKTWYFEVWNEPDLGGFWAGTQDEYFKLYQYTANAVKSISKNYRVGGPATARSKWIKPFLEFCAQTKTPVDMITTHSYNTKSVFDEFGKSKRKLMPFNYLYGNVSQARRIIDSTAYKGLPLHYTEFNSSPSSHDPIHDTYQNAPYILNTLKHAENTAASMSYWTFTDVFEEAGPALTPFHGGFGLLNLQDIKKPTFYAYKYLSSMGAQEITNADSESIVTCSKSGMDILLWDLKFPHADSVLNEIYFNELRPAQTDGNVMINVKNVPKGKYKVSVYRTGYLHNDPLSMYYRIGKPYYLNRKQELILKGGVTGSPESESTVVITNGGFNKTIAINENDIWFIRLTKI